jgi:hypothetical protein
LAKALHLATAQGREFALIPAASDVVATDDGRDPVGDLGGVAHAHAQNELCDGPSRLLLKVPALHSVGDTVALIGLGEIHTAVHLGVDIVEGTKVDQLKIAVFIARTHGEQQIRGDPGVRPLPGAHPGVATLLGPGSGVVTHVPSFVRIADGGGEFEEAIAVDVGHVLVAAACAAGLGGRHVVLGQRTHIGGHIDGGEFLGGLSPAAAQSRFKCGEERRRKQ